MRRLLPAFLVLFLVACSPEAVRRAQAQKEAQKLAAAMSDEELAAQVLLTAVSGTTGLSEKSARLLASVPVGGVMLFKYNLGQGTTAAQALIASIKGGEGGKLAPFVCVDHEGGLVHRFGADLTKLPPAASFGVLEKKRLREVTEGAALRAGRELRALGITVNLAPVAEVATPNSTVFLGTRAYSTQAELAAEAAAAFIRGMQKSGVACVAKHFPGNSASDPHYGRSFIGGGQGEESLSHLVAPFIRLFALFPPEALMVSHAVVTEVDNHLPATLSSRVIEDYLRQKLGYRGLAISDDLRMKAISAAGFTAEEAAVKAINAGIDMVMTWPEDVPALYNSLLAALKTGKLARSRLVQACERILTLKLSSASAEKPPLPSIEELKQDTAQYLTKEGVQ